MKKISSRHAICEFEYATKFTLETFKKLRYYENIGYFHVQTYSLANLQYG